MTLKQVIAAIDEESSGSDSLIAVARGIRIAAEVCEYELTNVEAIHYLDGLVTGWFLACTAGRGDCLEQIADLRQDWSVERAARISQAVSR